MADAVEDVSGGQPEQNHEAASEIFLRSSWRASHTWFWLKFRELSSTVSFYDPVHQSLATHPPIRGAIAGSGLAELKASRRRLLFD
jgi:hypothetical protein